MKKKGFTLIELLATIVVLSVIALIATPLILNVIEKAKKGTLVSSVNGLVESANMYYTNEIIKGDISEDVIFDFEEGIQTSEKQLSYKGKVYNGKLILTSNSDVITCIDDGKYYAYKEKDSDEVISGIGTCKYDGTTGDFTIESDVDVIPKECDKERSELQEQINNLTNNVNELRTTISEKEYEISNLESVIEGLENQIIILEGEKEELMNQLSNSNTSNSELQDRITELEGTIDALESSLEAKNNEIATLNGEKNELQNKLTTKTNELKTLNENLGKVTATSKDVLSGKTIIGSDGNLITGTMANNTNKTLSATTITESGDNALINIPSSGYYDETSKISVPIETIQNNLNSGILYYNLASELGATATVDSEFSDTYKAIYAINGDFNNRWLSYYAPGASSYTANIVIDLKTVKNINCILFLVTHSYGSVVYAGNVKGYYSLDDETYNEYFSKDLDIVGYCAGGSPVLTKLNKKARYIKLEITTLMGGGIANTIMSSFD